MNLNKITSFSLGPLLAALFNFASLPLLTWLFDSKSIGQFEMLRIIGSFTILVFSFGLDQAYVREYHESKNKPGLLKMALAPGFFVLILALAFSSFFVEPLLEAAYGDHTRNVFIITVFAVLSLLVSRFLSLVLRMEERGYAYSISIAAPRFFFLLSLLIIYWLGFSARFETLGWAHIASLGIVLAWLVFEVRSELKKAVIAKIDPGAVKSLAMYGAPLVLGGVAYWGLTALDRVALNMLSSFQEIGVYSIAARAAAAGAIFQQVFSVVWAPTIYKWAAKGEDLERVDRVVEYVLAVVIFLFCLGALFSWVTKYILAPEFSEVQFILVPCLAFPLLYTLSEATVVGVGLMKKTSFAMISSIVAFGVNLLLNWILIPKYGAKGAAIATSIAFFVFFVARTESSAYLWRPFPRVKAYLTTGTALALSALYGIKGEEFQLEILCLWGLFFVSSLFIFNKSLKEGWLFLKKKRAN